MVQKVSVDLVQYSLRYRGCSDRAQKRVVFVLTSLMLDTSLRSKRLADHISCGIKQEEPVKQSDGITNQAAVPDAYQRVLRTNGVFSN